MVRHLALLAALLPAARAIRCPAGSKCSSNCGNILTATSPDDLVCDQQAFQGDPTGQLFAGCVDCQRSSTYHSGNDSDIQTMLYNVRYALSYCVWGDMPAKNLKVVNSPCITTKACGSFKDAVQFKNLSTAYSAFQYCTIWPTDDESDLTGCTECLQAEGRWSMANFIIALQAGCLQKPSPGLFIGLDGEIFSPTAVQISSPSPTATVDPAWFDNGPLNLGAKVGIAMGTIVGVLILLGCGIIWNGKRRRRAFLRTLDAKYAPRGWPAPNKQHEMGETMGQPPGRGYNDTPLSQRPLRGRDDTPVSQDPSRSWDDSPPAAGSEQQVYGHLKGATSAQQAQAQAQAIPWLPAALAPDRQFGVVTTVTSSGTAGRYWGPHSTFDDKGKSRMEAYEMHKVDTPPSESGGPGEDHRPRQKSEGSALNHAGHEKRRDDTPSS